MWSLKVIFLAFVAVAFGFTVAGGYLALISLIGILPRLASTSKTAKYLIHYENALIYGVLIGTLVYSYNFYLPIGPIVPAMAGFFGGVFFGCLAGALAEVVNVIPIFARRANIRKGIPYIIYALGVGKGIGVLVQYFLLE